MNESQTSSLSRRLGPVFAEVAAQAANAQQGPKSGQQGVENPNPMPAPRQGIQTRPWRLPRMSPAFEWIPVLVCVGLIVACTAPLFFMKD